MYILDIFFLFSVQTLLLSQANLYPPGAHDAAHPLGAGPAVKDSGGKAVAADVP